MFIENALNPITSAPAERNVSPLAGRPTYVSLRWSEEDLLAVLRFYKHLAPLGRKWHHGARTGYWPPTTDHWLL